jgi:two-component system response regulator (stage 0 sporulation protein F)
MNRILVVDDDTAIRLLYTDELTEEGYEVITGDGGSGLMELIEKKRPDLVVLDIPPGDHEGLGLFQTIRNAYDDLPVILSTAYAAARPDVRSAAVERHVGRSSDFTELKRAIRRAFEGLDRFPPGAMLNYAQSDVSPLQGTV